MECAMNLRNSSAVMDVFLMVVECSWYDSRSRLPGFLPQMLKIIKQMIRLVCRSYTSDDADWSISVVVLYLMDPVEFCTIALIISGLLLLIAL